MSDSNDNGMIPKSKTIGDYFQLNSREQFLIPSFQRAYSWGKDQCEKLLEDLFDYHENRVDSDSTYFFGNIITVTDKSINSIQIIDGQQRTTTFILLLKALHFILNNYKCKAKDFDSTQNRKIDKWLESILMKIYKIDSNSISDYQLIDFTEIFFKKEKFDDNFLIMKSESMNEMEYAISDWEKILKSSKFADIHPYEIPYKKKENRYTNFYKNISYFYKRIHQKLQENNKTEAEQINYLAQFIQTLLEKCKIIQIASQNLDLAVAVFNSLNATGLPLSDADVICSSAYARCRDDESKSKFKDNWYLLLNNVEQYLGDNFCLTTILQQFMYHNRFYESAIENQKTDVTTPGLRKYYTSDKTHFVENPLPFCTNLNLLVSIWKKALSYSIVRLSLKINNNTHLFLGTMLYHWVARQFEDTSTISEEEIDDALNYESVIKPISELFLRLFALLELVEYSYSSSRFKVFLFDVGDEFVRLKKENSFDSIIDKFNNNIFNIINDSIGSLKNKLLDYRSDKLVLLNEYLYCEEHNLDFYLDEEPSKINIEHIMPKSGNNVPDYMNNLSVEEYSDYLEKLGNKILLERKININLSDDPFKIKKYASINTVRNGSKSTDLGYKNSCYAIAKDLCNYKNDTWTSEDIENATNKCVCRIYNFIIKPLNDSQIKAVNEKK